MRSGFSLVELSIVLVILGLLTGGILAGQSLIHAAELRSVNAQFQRYQSAYYTFRDKYFAMPGDMANAYSFWGVAAGCTNVDVNGDVNGCNGNGDGLIISANNGETARTWQHLALAGLIEGTYSGISLTDPYRPTGKLGNSWWSVKNWSRAAHGWLPNSGEAAVRTNQFYFNGSTGFKTEDAWNIDVKMDDGHAFRGKVFAHAVSGPCVTGTAWATDNYALGGTGSGCVLLMIID